MPAQPKTILRSTLTCPECGASKEEIMPTNSCEFFYQCTFCDALLKSRAGDCCVFCSYGTVPCPSRQEKRCSNSLDL
ncbi:MAG: GDCCVxC domain-containing (seleno)protein [Proteobacteria bacterium]|nr:GDCCVxC domain-containing (seleno)protein [Pseudomonadota bacterium]